MYNPKKTVYKKKKIPFFKRFITYGIYCLSTSTICGLIHIVRPNRFIVERLLWLLLVIIGLVMTTWQSINVWNHYQQKPVLIIVEKDFSNWNVKFPSVFICYKNFTSDLKKKISKLAKDLNYDANTLERYLYDLVFNDYTSYKNLILYANGTRKELFSPDQYMNIIKQLVPSFQKRKSSSLYYPDERGTFEPVFTEFGLCNVFHNDFAGYFHINNTKINKINYVYNITTKLYATTERTFGVDLSSKFNAYVIGYNEWIDITSDFYFGFDLTLLDVNLDQIFSISSQPEIKDLNIVQRNCRFADESELTYSPYYTFNLCRIDCRIKLCMKLCQCTPYYYKRINEPICDMKGLFCLAQYEYMLINLVDEKGKNICPCLQACNLQTTITRVTNRDDFFLSSGFRVKFVDFPNEQFIRTLVFTKTDVLIQIGGFFGFFLGCTLLSFVEVPYFLTFRFILAVIYNRKIKPSL